MDEQAVNLAKAIRQHESGGDFAIKGKSAEYGAYQWTPGTWEQHSKEILGTVPKFASEKMTPAVQNAVAYGIIKKWKDSGLNVAQISAKWNSGSETGWENKIGKNKFGVEYNVPKYVKSVSDIYQQNKIATVAEEIQQPTVPIQEVLPVPEQSSKNSGFLSRLVNDPINTLVIEQATKFGQGIAGLGVEMFGSEATKQKFAEEVQKPTTVPGIFNDTVVQGQKQLGNGGASQIAGQALESASYLAPVGRVGKVAESYATGKFGKALLGGVGIGAYGGTMGGAGQALQENPTLENVATQTGIGAVAGGALGGALGIAVPTALGLASSASKFRKPIIDATESRLEQKIADTLKLTPKQIRLEERFAKNTPKFVVDEGVAGLIKTSDGKTLDTTDAVTALAQKAEAENKAFQDILEVEPRYLSFEKAKQEAIRKAENQFYGTDRAKAVSKINNEFDAYESQFSNQNIVDNDGDVLATSADFNKAKQDAWKKTKGFGNADAILENDVNYLIGSVLKDNIELAYGEDVAIKELNRRLGEFASAIKLLDQRHGTKLPGGMLGRTAFRIAGAVSATSYGPIGQIAGALTGGRLAEILQDPKISTFMARKIIEKLGSSKVGKSIIEEAEKIMQMKATRAIEMKALPAPSYIPMGAGKDTSFVKGVPAEKNPVSNNAITGKFQKTYSSTVK